MLKKPVTYLFSGIILLVCGFGWQLFYGDYYSSPTYIASLVEDKLEYELTETEYQMIPVLDSVSTVDILEFSDYNLTPKYPYFIYRNGELKVWSDYHFIPSYDQIKGEESLQLINQSESLYLMRKWYSESESGQYEVISLIPIQVRFSVQNRYLSDYSNFSLFKDNEVTLYKSAQPNSLPVQVRGVPLFWLADNSGLEPNNSPFKFNLFLIFTAAILLLIIAASKWALSRVKRYGQWVIILGILLYWGALKLSMFWFNFPERFISADIFDSRFFAVSWFERSFADMLLNTIAILLISIVTFKAYRKVQRSTSLTRTRVIIVGSFQVLMLNLIINYQYLQLRTIYFNSQISLDLTQTFGFESFKLLAVLIFIMIGVSTALFFHVVFKRLEANTSEFKIMVLVLVLGSLAYWLFTLLVNIPPANLVLVTVLLSIILFSTGIHRSLQQASFALSLYVLLWVVVESAIGGWCITEFEHTRDTNQMVRFAQNLALKNDYMAEFMIQEVIESIENDPSISARLSNPFLSKEYIVNKIAKGYLNKYLDKYTTAIYLYSHSGEGLPGFGTTLNYFEIKQRYGLEVNKTEYQNLYVLTQDVRSLSKHYMAFVPVKRYSNVIGYIILDFRQKRLVPENVYPELLVDNRFRDFQNNEFSYAIFEENYLIHSSGDMDYSKLDLNLLYSRNLWTQNGYRHYKIVDRGEDVIVVSKAQNYFWQLVSNASFLIASFLLPIILILIIVLISNLNKGKEISYIAKIQLFLNLAFFLPLVVVTITTLSFITTSFRDELLQGKVSESNRLATQIEKETDAYLVDVNAKDLLNDKLIQLSSYGNFDATIFGTDGIMITTTQPDIFTNGLQSGYLNNQAFERLIEGNETNIVLDEIIGSLNYYTTYSAIRSKETNRLLGVLAIPFFRAESAIESNQIKAFTTILNVFVLIFLLALIATFQTSKWLTAPLVLIRDRLGKTSFAGENRPIDWDSEDEIGNLIREYNKMLVKLEASKDALARSQKESAWREVAQQVAHEIKNPLTPMKLTLQKLEQAISKKDMASMAQIETAVKNLLNQLQMLNDIVTSFSEFAKMPIPQNSRMDIAEVLKELRSFFDNQEHLTVELQLHADPVYISADRKLMSRILSNIIINASQSIKEDQNSVMVRIMSSKVPESGAVRIAISDNGTGIAKDVIDRVFIPRFSTKEEGSGIGLAVAKHGVEHAGGTIWFETSWGEGTTFYLQLPELE